MNKTYHFCPCPHCGEPMRSGTLARHEPVCVKKPENYARIRAVLTGGAHGVTYNRYLELSKDDKSLPSLNTLIRHTKSTNWNGVLAFFRLPLPPQEVCQQQPTVRHIESKAQTKRKPQPKPAPVEPQPVALAIVPPVERATVPLPRITPTVNKWQGLKGYDPTWKAPTGNTQWLVQVQPGERTCLACGDTFAPGGYCMRCGTRADGTRRSKDNMPPSVATADYLRPGEYRIEH